MDNGPVYLLASCEFYWLYLAASHLVIMAFTNMWNVRDISYPVGCMENLL